MTQGYNQLNLFNKNLPMVMNGGGFPNKIPGIQYQEIPEPLIRKPFDIGEGKQVGYKLPDGTYTSNQDLVRIAKQQAQRGQLLKETAKLKSMGKVGGITGAIATPIAIYSHKDAYKYYDDIIKNPSATPEQKSLATAMKMKEAVNMMAEGPGTAIGAAIGSRGGKWGQTAGTFLPALLSQGVSWAVNKGLQPSMEKYGLKPYNGFNISGDSISPVNNGVQQNPQPQPQSMNNGIAGAGTPTGMASGVPTGGAITPQDIANAQAEAEATGNTDAMDAINKYVAQMQEINKPYIEGLQNYLANYNDYLNNYHRARDFYTGLAGWSGNSQWADVGKDYNTLSNEANKLAILKQAQDAQLGNINAINEMMGNIAIAEELGLPPEAAFSNKNLLTAFSMKDRENNRYRIAMENNLMKKYGIDRNFARAIITRQMANDNAINVANIYAGGYGNPAGRTGAIPSTMGQIQSQPSGGEAALFKQVTGR